MKNQNLNKGDKLLCKKDSFYSNYVLTEGIEYEILSIIVNYIPTYNHYSIIGDYNYYIKDDDGELCLIYETDFYDFFCSKNELRKIKLTKIYEESES